MVARRPTVGHRRGCRPAPPPDPIAAPASEMPPVAVVKPEKAGPQPEAAPEPKPGKVTA
jgi:hypothetical protein